LITFLVLAAVSNCGADLMGSHSCSGRRGPWETGPTSKRWAGKRAEEERGGEKRREEAFLVMWPAEEAFCLKSAPAKLYCLEESRRQFFDTVVWMTGRAFDL